MPSICILYKLRIGVSMINPRQAQRKIPPAKISAGAPGGTGLTRIHLEVLSGMVAARGVDGGTLGGCRARAGRPPANPPLRIRTQRRNSPNCAPRLSIMHRLCACIADGLKHRSAR